MDKWWRNILGFELGSWTHRRRSEGTPQRELRAGRDASQRWRRFVGDQGSGGVSWAGAPPPQERRGVSVHCSPWPGVPARMGQDSRPLWLSHTLIPPHGSTGNCSKWYPPRVPGPPAARRPCREGAGGRLGTPCCWLVSRARSLYSLPQHGPPHWRSTVEGGMAPAPGRPGMLASSGAAASSPSGIFMSEDAGVPDVSRCLAASQCLDGTPVAEGASS